MVLNIINLYGTYRGFIRIREKEEGSTVECRGVPEGAKIYLISTNSKLFEVKSMDVVKLKPESFSGALAAQRIDGAWSIIMQGSLRGGVKNIEAIKRALWWELNHSNDAPSKNAKDEEVKEPSEALKGILSDAELLFDEKRMDEENQNIKNNINDKADTPTREFTPSLLNKNNRNNNKNFSGNQRPNAVFNPFSKTYPDSNWEMRRLRGNSWMLEGIVRLAGERLHVQAIPGNMVGEHQNIEKLGFTRFARDDNGRGYWLRVKYIPKQGERKPESEVKNENNRDDGRKQNK